MVIKIRSRGEAREEGGTPRRAKLRRVPRRDDDDDDGAPRYR